MKKIIILALFLIAFDLFSYNISGGLFYEIHRSTTENKETPGFRFNFEGEQSLGYAFNFNQELDAFISSEKREISPTVTANFFTTLLYSTLKFSLDNYIDSDSDTCSYTIYRSDLDVNFNISSLITFNISGYIEQQDYLKNDYNTDQLNWNLQPSIDFFLGKLFNVKAEDNYEVSHSTDTYNTYEKNNAKITLELTPLKYASFELEVENEDYDQKTDYEDMSYNDYKFNITGDENNKKHLDYNIEFQFTKRKNEMPSSYSPDYKEISGSTRLILNILKNSQIYILPEWTKQDAEELDDQLYDMGVLDSFTDKSTRFGYKFSVSNKTFEIYSKLEKETHSDTTLSFNSATLYAYYSNFKNKNYINVSSSFTKKDYKQNEEDSSNNDYNSISFYGSIKHFFGKKTYLKSDINLSYERHLEDDTLNSTFFKVYFGLGYDF